MQRSNESDFLLLSHSSLDDFDVPDDGFALVIGEIESGGIRYPDVDSSSTRVDVEQMLKSKIIFARAHKDQFAH